MSSARGELTISSLFHCWFIELPSVIFVGLSWMDCGAGGFQLSETRKTLLATCNRESLMFTYTNWLSADEQMVLVQIYSFNNGPCFVTWFQGMPISVTSNISMAICFACIVFILILCAMIICNTWFEMFLCWKNVGKVYMLCLHNLHPRTYSWHVIAVKGLP